MPLHLAVLLALAAHLGLASPVAAQGIEMPAPFDTVGRVSVITPALADSFHLEAPAWPVRGPFVEARLYRQQSGGFVLLVTRPGGAIERFALLDEARLTIAARVAASGGAPSIGNAAVIARGNADATAGPMARMPGPAAPDIDLARAMSQQRDEALRQRFVGNQLVLGAALFGPLASSLVYRTSKDRLFASATELAATGVTYAVARQVARPGAITPSQRYLTTHAALHGAAIGATLTYAAGADTNWKGAGYRLAALGGAVAGDVAGFVAGRWMAPATASASGMAADFAAVTTLLASVPNDAASSWPIGRGRAGAAAGAALAGYALGPLYTVGRTDVTPGDVTSLAVGGGIGLLAAASIYPGRSADDHPRANGAALAIGLLAGAVAADAFFVRPFDHTQGQAGLLAAGAGAGALIALQVPGVVDDRRGPRRPIIGATIGAVGGAWALEASMRSRTRGRALSSSREPAAVPRLAFDFYPLSALASLATRTSGGQPATVATLHF